MSTASRPAVIPTGYGETGTQLAPTNPQLTAGAVALSKIGFGLWNWLEFFLSNGIRYLSRAGVTTWSAAETYIAGDIVRGTHGSLYIAMAGSTNQDPEGPTTSSNEWLPLWSGGLMGSYLDPDSGPHSDINVTSSLNVSGDYSAKNLTVQAGGVFSITGGILRVQGTLHVVSGGVVRPNVPGSLDGTAGSGGGTAGTGGNASASGTIFGGSSGGSGGGTSSAGSPGATITDAIGGSGGNGGAGSGGTGGSGTAPFTAYDKTIATSVLQCARDGGFGVKRGGSGTARVPTAFGLQGGGGGGGGGGSSGADIGGGGGAGGGLLIAFVNHLNVETDGGLLAAGGKGGNATGTAAPGAGGGGGGIIVLARSITGATLTDANCCPGGAAGTGGTGAPTAGNPGNLYLFQV